MKRTIHPINGDVPLEAQPPRRSAIGADYEPVVYVVGDERIHCTFLDRADPTGAAEYRIGLASQPPLSALVLLQERRGFVAALSGIYGQDLSRGFDRVVYIREIHGSPAFVADPDYRRAVILELCRRTLATSGFVALRPARGVWKMATPAIPTTGPALSEPFTLCRLFGACGFAQLCDSEVLDAPVPLFLQPWKVDEGLLPLRRPPKESFSRALCVHRLRRGRMILFEKTRP